MSIYVDDNVYVCLSVCLYLNDRANVSCITHPHPCPPARKPATAAESNASPTYPPIQCSSRQKLSIWTLMVWRVGGWSRDGFTAEAEHQINSEGIIWNVTAKDA